MPVLYVLDYEGERPEGDLIDVSGDLVDDLDAETPEQFETLDEALARLAEQD